VPPSPGRNAFGSPVSLCACPPQGTGTARNNPTEFVSVWLAAKAIGVAVTWTRYAPIGSIPFHLIGASSVEAVLRLEGGPDLSRWGYRSGPGHHRRGDRVSHQCQRHSLARMMTASDLAKAGAPRIINHLQLWTERRAGLGSPRLPDVLTR